MRPGIRQAGIAQLGSRQYVFEAVEVLDARQAGILSQTHRGQASVPAAPGRCGPGIAREDPRRSLIARWTVTAAARDAARDDELEKAGSLTAGEPRDLFLQRGRGRRRGG